MTNKITPEQARELLDRVKEGCPLPWEIFTTETIERDPREVKNVRYSDPDYDGHLAYSMDYDGTTEIDPDAIELIAAAPALAEQIANMRYEYAVQVLMGDGEWYFADEDSLPFGSLKPYEVRWYTKKEVQEILDAEVDCFGPKDIRIVRRLAGESEVVE